MTIAGIPVTVKDGRVEPLAKEYWRLVMIGESLARGDEFRRIVSGDWVSTLCAGKKHPPSNACGSDLFYRRRVKGVR